MPIDKSILEEYVATANSGKYKSFEEVNAKFPELKGYDAGVLEEYVATANSGKYKSFDEINEKFPELFSDKKKKETFGLGFGTASEASALTRPQAKVPFKSPSETKPNFTKPQPRLSAEEQQAQGMVTKQAKAEKALEFKEGVKQKLYDNNRYWLLQNKKEAQQMGVPLKDLYNQRNMELANNYLDDIDQREANALLSHLDAKQRGDEKLTSESLKQYYAAKNEQRAKFKSEMDALQSEYDNISNRIQNGQLDANLGGKTLSAIENRKRNLELGQKAFLNPKKALNDFVSDNATEIASVSKPTQTPYEQLQEYTNSLYAKVRQLKADLRYQDMGKGATLGGYAQDYVIRNEEGGGELLDELYAEEFKLKNAVKLLLLNRTPIPANETALGVIGKSFANTLAPNLQKEQGTAQAIANNVKEIVQDAELGKQVYEEQQKFAEEEAKPYETYSAKWFAEPMGASLAIVPEFVIGSLVTEGALGLTKLGKMLSIAEKYGKVKGLNTTAKYVNAVNKNAAGKVADTIGKTFIKTQANGLKFGATSEVVSQLFPSQEDEINFTTGYFGGVIGKGVEGAVSSAAQNLFKVFGNKGVEAAKKISELGGNMKFMKDAPKTVLGELGEEFGESLGQIYQESDSWNEIKSKIDEQFGTLDKATQFVVQTAIMALGMGAGNQIGINLHKSSKDAYNQLPREERAKVDAILDDVKKEDTKVAEDVAEQVEAELSSDKEIAKEIETIKQEDAEQATTIEEETIETPSSETVTDTIVSDGSATPTTVESTEVAPEVVSETISEIEPPVVEQTTTDVGGVTTPDVSEAKALEDKKASLDEKAKKLGYIGIKQFNSQNQLNENLSNEEKTLLQEYSDFQQEVKNLKDENVISKLSDDEFSSWSKANDIKRDDLGKVVKDEEIELAAKRIRILNARGDSKKADSELKKLKESKKKDNWTVESWKEGFDEDIEQSEIDDINQSNKEFNESLDKAVEELLGAKPSESARKSENLEVSDDVAMFEQVLTINDTTKLKSSKKAKIKEVIESKADNDIISYIAENIDDIKAQLRDKVGLTTECKW